MDLKKLVEWAISYDQEKIKKELMRMDPEGVRINELGKIESYMGMIRDRGGAAIQFQIKVNGYLDDVEEYVGKLKDKGFTIKEEKPQVDEPSPMDTGGVLPLENDNPATEEGKPDGSEHLSEGQQESTESETVL